MIKSKSKRKIGILDLLTLNLTPTLNHTLT